MDTLYPTPYPAQVERTVFYRERAAGYYAVLPYALAQGTVEHPYTLVQAIIYSAIVYSMVGFQWTAAKCASQQAPME